MYRVSANLLFLQGTHVLRFSIKGVLTLFRMFMNKLNLNLQSLFYFYQSTSMISIRIHTGTVTQWMDCVTATEEIIFGASS